MADVKIIKRLHYVKSWGKRRIARELGISRRTVRRVLAGESTGEYRQKEQRPRPVADQIEPVIRDLLKEEKARRTPRKQRLTAKQVERILRREHAYAGGEATVRRAVARVRIELGDVLADAMVPLSYEPGEAAQVDFLEADIDYPSGRERRYFLLVRACYSGRPFVYQAPAENQEALLDGLSLAFEHFGGVFDKLWFDNLTPAVKKVLESRARELQARFGSFEAHYAFEAEFCNVGKGNEKGGVENGVRYFRRSALSPLPDVADDAALDLELARWMDAEQSRTVRGRSAPIRELWEEEQARLIPLPACQFRDYRSSSATVSSYSLVQAGRNYYSVPVTSVGQRVTLRWRSRRVEIYGGVEKLAEHRRCYGCDEVEMELAHYLPLLERKTRAFDQAAPVRRVRANWPESYELLLRILRSREGEAGGTRSFIGVLLLHEHHGEAEIRSAVKRALTHVEPSLAVVRYYLDGLIQATAPREALSTLGASVPKIEVLSRRPADYDALCPEVRKS